MYTVFSCLTPDSPSWSDDLIKVISLKIALISFVALLLNACQSITPSPSLSEGHINKGYLAEEENNNNLDIPKTVSAAPALPIPRPQVKEETHTVIVNNVPVAELLFSLARDAKLNLDIDSDVSGGVTLNAVDQPLTAILERIVESANLTYTIKNQVLRVRKDYPFLKNYRIDYINMTRSSESVAAVATQIKSTGQGAEEESSGGSNNNSTTDVKNLSSNAFWDTLKDNVVAIMASNGTSGKREDIEKNLVINKESGILGVRATQRQHKEIDTFINEVIFSSRRQVLIEATIAEITLSDAYQAGVDWSRLGNPLDNSVVDVSQQFTDIPLFNRPSFNYSIKTITSGGDTIQTTLSALEEFGDVSIMSSPKVMALNNQTALLKVVDNIIYFSVEVNVDASQNNNGDNVGFVTYETEINTVPVGFVMSVTPFINDEDMVTLNMRPTISRVIGQARDPNPSLADAGVISEVPVIQVREVESMLKVNSGDIAIMGGLMQDKLEKRTRGVPVLSRIPLVGSLFRYDNDRNEKTELIIFIKPTVIKNASLHSDLRAYKKFLPGN